MMGSDVTTDEKSLRVSVATLNRVIFTHPQDGNLMLALERRATVMDEGGHSIRVRAQPFGGAVHILDPNPLRQLIGEIEFDSERSRHERDFRILIRPADWESVKQFCWHHLGNPNDLVLEPGPRRELIEEFSETLNVGLKPDQYTAQSKRFIIENNPVPTDNIYALEQLTVRIYQIYEVCITDVLLWQTMLTASQRYSDQELGNLALKDFQNGGRGYANTILTLSLDSVIDSYLGLPPEFRFKTIDIAGQLLDESVLAILEGLDIPQYRRLGLHS